MKQLSKMTLDLQPIVDFFTIDIIETIAKATSFIQRLRQLDAMTFVGMFTFGLIHQPDASLNQLVSIGKKITPTFSMTAEGLHQKLTEKAVDFLRTLFAKSLEISSHAADSFKLLSFFTKVHLLDSTSVSLPDELGEEFKGSGGNASKACLKFQLMLEYNSGTFSHLWLTGGTEPDQNQMDVALEYISKGELLLHDLGYFSQNALQKIESGGAFFVSRYDPKTALYYHSDNGVWQRLNLLATLSNETHLRELSVLYGCKAKLPCRLIAQRVSDTVAERRKRQKRQNAQKKGRTVSKFSLALCHWDFIPLDGKLQA